MNKLGKITAGLMGLVLSLGIAVSPVNALTKFEFDDWNVLDGYYGTKEKVDDVVTKLTGKDHGEEAFPGQAIGAYTKKSEGALLKDGITEELYVELDLNKFENEEYFEATVSLDESEEKKANGELTERVVMTQKFGDKFIVNGGNWSSKTFATVTESGVYTYRWHYFLKGDKAYVNFTLLLGDKVVGKSGDEEVSEVTAENKDTVSVRSVWFCNIRVAKGLLVHSRLPETTVEVEKDSKVTVEDKNVADVLKDSLANLKEAAELATADVEITLEADEKNDVDADTKASFEKVAGEGKVAEYLDIDVLVKAGEKSYNLHELTEKVNLTVAVPKDIPAVAEGYTRTYYILREHNGVVEKLETTLSKDGKNLTFATDKFSTYGIVYLDNKTPVTEDEETENPKTYDGITNYVVIGGISVVTLAGVCFYISKKRLFN